MPSGSDYSALILPKDKTATPKAAPLPTGGSRSTGVGRIAAAATRYNVQPSTIKSLYTPTAKAPTGGGNQAQFGAAFAKETGLNPGIVGKWLAHEQPANSPATPGSNNWLNVQYTDSGPNSTYFKIAGMPPAQAAKATAEWLRGQSGLKGILASAGKSPQQQAEAIVNSGWASSHYGGVQSFLSGSTAPIASTGGTAAIPGGATNMGSTSGNTGITAIPGTKGAGSEEAFNEAGYNKAQSDYTVGKLFKGEPGNPLVAIGGLRTAEPERGEFTSIVPAQPTQSGQLGSSVVPTGASGATSTAALPNPPPNANLKPVVAPVKVQLPGYIQGIDKAKQALERSEHHPVSIHELERAVGYGEKPPIPTPHGAVHATAKGPVYMPHKRPVTGGVQA